MESNGALDARIIAHLDFARAVAARAAGLPGRRADRDDLVGWGTLGLVQAAHRYREATGVSFAAFAARRIRGCVQDALRSADPLTRSERRTFRAALAVREDLPPPYREVSLDALREQGLEPADAPEPERPACRDPRWALVSGVLARLPARERRVLVLSYGRCLTLREVGRVMGLSESGVCRLRARALAHVRRTCDDA